MVAHLRRLFIILSLATVLLFNLTGILALKILQSPVHVPVLQTFAETLSSATLLGEMGTAIPYLARTVQASAPQTAPTIPDSLLQALAGLMPSDALGMMGKEIPGLIPFEQTKQAAAGSQAEPVWQIESAAPGERAVPPAAAKGQSSGVKEALSAATTEKPAAERPKTTPNKEVLVYNTHNRESWLSVTDPAPGTRSVDDKTKNISLVGKHLADMLNERGIGTEFLQEDIYQELLDSGKSYPFSYAQSLKAITQAAQKNRHLYYYFDLHRDDSPREKTTVTIGGKSYARLMFVIGKRNPNYQENLKVANELQQLIEKKYPGLTRGVDDKGENEGNGEYNQHVSPGSLLLEVGGTGNTIEECYHTVEAFADVFAEYFWQAKRS